MKVKQTTLSIRGDFSDRDHAWNMFLAILNRLTLDVRSTLRHEFTQGAIAGCVILADGHAFIRTDPLGRRAFVELWHTGYRVLGAFQAEVSEHWTISDDEPRPGVLPLLRVYDERAA